MSMRIASVCASLMVLASGFSVQAATPLPNFTARRIQQDLAKRLNVPSDFIRINMNEATPQVWPDQCLGLARPNERCQGGDVRGWEVKAYSTQQSWTYRSDRTARRLRLEPLPGATELNSQEFSAQIAQKLLSTASQQVQQHVTNLQILQVRATTSNGCLSMTTPNTPCSETVTPGFKVIIADGERNNPNNGYDYEYLPDTLQREWVYSLSEDGAQIIYNEAASDTKGSVAVYSKESSSEASISLGSEIIAEQKIIDYQSGSQQWITLTADGKITYHLGSLDPNEPHELITTIQPSEVASFKALLSARHFDNFDNMNYSNIDPYWVSEGYWTLTAGGTSVSLQVAELDELPTDLQTITGAWNALLVTW